MPALYALFVWFPGHDLMVYTFASDKDAFAARAMALQNGARVEQRPVPVGTLVGWCEAEEWVHQRLLEAPDWFLNEMDLPF